MSIKTVKNKTRVIIIGTGLSGLALAQALRKQQISFLIFERDAGIQTRHQGWAVAFHTVLNDLLGSIPHDLTPLHECAVTQGLGRGATYSSRAAVYDLYSGEKQVEIGADVGQPGFFIRVNRHRMHNWLAEHIDVQWNKRILRYEENEDGVTALFDDGTSVTGDMLIGAEGMNSHVRSQLMGSEAPQFHSLGSSMIFGEVTLSKAQYEIQVNIARSFYFLYGKDFRFLIGISSVAEDKLTAEYYWALTWVDPEASKQNYWVSSASPEERLAFALKKMENVPECFAIVVKLTTAERVSSPFKMMDFVPKELPRGRVSLIGDAAHTMTPFRGEGANHAIQDGLNLAKIMSSEISLTEGLTGTSWDVPVLLKTYEAEILPRATKAVLGSREAAFDISGKMTIGALKSWHSKKAT